MVKIKTISISQKNIKNYVKEKNTFIKNYVKVISIIQNTFFCQPNPSSIPSIHISLKRNIDQILLDSVFLVCDIKVPVDLREVGQIIKIRSLRNIPQPAAVYGVVFFDQSTATVFQR